MLFERKSKRCTKVRRDGTTERLTGALVDRGVTRSIAEATVAECSSDHITSQLEVFDWVMANQPARASKNPAGFLINSIRGEYQPPPQFVSREEAARREAQANERRQKALERARAQEAQVAAKQAAREDALRSFWTDLSDEERERLEAEALLKATPMQREVIKRGGSFASATKKNLLDAFALKMLKVAA